MAKIWVTNEASSFAKTFSEWCLETGKHIFVNDIENDEFDYFRQENIFREKEIDIFDPTLPNLISRSGVELIIHQLPITPDKCIKHPDYAVRNNVEGSYYIIESAKENNIPIFFITTKNYSEIMKNNIHDVYDITAQAVENILNISGVRHMSIIPPTIYGHLFDEDISGLIKSSFSGGQVIFNRNVEEERTFIHAYDFISAIDALIDSINIETDDFKDFRYISIDGDYSSTQKIISILHSLNIKPNYKQSTKCRKEYTPNFIDSVNTMLNWEPKFNLQSGIEDVVEKVKKRYDN